MFKRTRARILPYKKVIHMKRAYILLSLVFLISALGIWLSLNITTSSYIPRFVKDAYYYLQAQILADEKLVKYLLYQAKLDGKECLDSITLHYPNLNDKIKIQYHYPIAQCKSQISSDQQRCKFKPRWYHNRAYEYSVKYTKKC